MVLARLAEYLNLHSTQHSLVNGTSTNGSHAFAAPGGIAGQGGGSRSQEENATLQDLEEPRRPYPHAILAGGIGGLAGDMLMHSLDTVKTRQQGDPHRPAKYNALASTYWTILRQEGVPRGLYGGVLPAALGSFAGTSIFFGSYEWSKRLMIDNGMLPSLAYLNAGLVADLIASPVYVPSEVLKTRLQLQGRHNNPHFESGYNYRSLWDATRTMVRTEGVSALYYGYRATLYRDLPFSALQFTIYEKAREWAKWFVGSPNIGLSLEILTGATAGGLAGTLTCPLDVVKTRIQTQVNRRPTPFGTQRYVAESSSVRTGPTSKPAAVANSAASKSTLGSSAQRLRHISTSSASTSIPQPGSITLDTSSVLTGLKLIYKTEGLAGWFRGVGPRAVWTSVQSGAMFVLYQTLLAWFSDYSATTA